MSKTATVELDGPLSFVKSVDQHGVVTYDAVLSRSVTVGLAKGTASASLGTNGQLAAALQVENTVINIGIGAKAWVQVGNIASDVQTAIDNVVYDVRVCVGKGQCGF